MTPPQFIRRLLSHAAMAKLTWALIGAAVLVLTLLPVAGRAATGAAPITVPFDHFATGFELDGIHRDLPCESCHLNAVFKGTPRNCGVCHITGSVYNATPKTPTHIQSTNNCAACHDTNSFRPDVHFNHQEVMGTCVSCHNGTVAQGEGTAHPATTQACEACHTVMSWNPPKTVDHTQIPMAVAGFCIICHNGQQASGKPANHIATSLECGDCHLTTNWLGASFNHTGILTGCATCHNGVKAVGKQGSHMPTTNLCENCHTTGVGTATPSWVPSKFDHTQMTVTTCATCHSGSVKISTGFVSGQPTNHLPPIPSKVDCAVCHGNTPTAETWDVIVASIPTLHAGLNVSNCLLCHAGQTFAGLPAPYVPMSVSGISPTKKTPLAPPHIPVNAGTDCSACHGPAYSAGGFGPATAMNATTHTFVSTTCDTCHDTGKSFYVGSGAPLQLRPADHVNSGDPHMATGDCSACHETKDWVSTVLPAGHMPNPANLNCMQCHASAPTDYTPATLAANSALHTGITANCGQCHGDTVTALTWFNNFTPKDAILTPSHIPYLSGTDCSSCHSSSTFAAGTFGPMNMTQAKHAFVPTACNTCHEAGLTFTLGAASPGLQGRPADHTSGNMVAPNDCSLCHTTANWNSTVLPTGHMPNPANQACTVCHITAPIDYTTATLAAISVLHTGISGGCAQCHGGTTALTWYNNYTPKDGVLTPAHIPYTAGTDCSSCHASTFAVGGFGPTNMSAAKHAFVPTTCDTCHDTAPGTFYLGASTPALQTRPADHIASGDAQQKSGDCSICHTPASWLSNTLPIGHMPNPGNQACAVCHIAIDGTFAGYATMGSIAALHTGITTNCGQCHGATATGALSFYNGNDPPKPAVTGHIPYIAGSDCGSCHAQTYATGGFGPVTMSAAKHAFVPTTCDDCHDASGGGPWYMGTATPLQLRPTDHTTAGGQQATSDCSTCHNTTDWTSNVMPPNHMPNPGAQTCSVCHTAIAGTLASYNTLASISVLHTGITGNCSQCHGNTAALSFANNNDVPKYADSVAHIPYLNGVDCSSCHTANYQTGGFGPATAMSPATHAFAPTTCDTCHDVAHGYYTGTGPALQLRPPTHVSNPNPASQATGDCSLCHNTTTWAAPSNLPNGHMPIPGTQTCSVCHLGTLTADPASYANMAPIPVLHTGITSGCAQCHGQTQLVFYNSNDPPLPAHANHIPAFTVEDCSSCHAADYQTGGFGPMNMTQATHNGVGAACNICHGEGVGPFYMGAASPGLQSRPADHTATNMAAPTDCSVCHTTANWLSSTLPSQHMPNPAGAACNTCHVAAPANYVTLASNAVIHTGISNGCAQCHGQTQLVFYNSNDPPLPMHANHMAYLAGTDCGACHTSATYAAGSFGPLNMTPALHSFVSTTCDGCHASAPGSLYMGLANPALQLRPADHSSGTMLTGDCGACHTPANWNSTVLPAGHMPNPANQTCTVCHTTAPTDYSTATLAANSILHTGISGGCSTCHGGSAALTWYNNFTPKDGVLSPPHIPYSAGTDCSSCHSSSTYAAGTFGPMNMTQATHSFVSTTCDTCHGVAAGSLYMGLANPALQLRPADHSTGTMLTGDCSGCHTTANWNSTALPTGHMPNPANQTCTVCHTTAPTDYTTATLAANSVLHTGITGNCSQCHGGTTALTWYSNFTPKDAVLTPAHIPVLSGTDCSSCHSSTSYAAGTFGPMNMTQAKHAFVSTTCDTCHGVAAGSFYMGLANPALQLRPADHTAGTMLTGDCSGCHTTANWNSTALPTGHMPNPANSACAVCHTTAPADYSTTTLAANATLHTGITSGCITCHGAPNAAAPVFYPNYTPKDAILSPVHIPTAATPCEDCHSATTFTAFSGTTMTAAKHTSMFTVIGNTCDACHNKVTPALSFYGVTNLQTRPSDHNSGSKATNDCSGCHNPSQWDSSQLKKTVRATASVPAKIGTVVTAPLATAAAATAAATTVGAAPGATAGAATRAGLSHFGVTSNCAACHNGVLATGKGVNHLVTNNTCENCHTVSAWLPARFDHQGVAAACASCHNGAIAGGVPPRHVPSNQDCGTCHGTVAWTPAVFNHTGIAAACQSCHNGITATGRQATHVVTAQDCGTCHTTLSWTVSPTPKAPLKPLLAPKPNPRAAGIGPGG